jgi:GntR family transcriptional regulator
MNMAFKKTKWKEVYEVLKERISSGEYKPGSEFPTNKEIGEEFSIHPSSITLATKELMREGLLFEPKRKATRRIVRNFPTRSRRMGGFSGDSDPSEKPRKELVELRVIKNQDELPKEVSEKMKVPVLFYHHNQFKGEELVANSQSYIPSSIFPIGELERRLKVEGVSLYKTFAALGHEEDEHEEDLIAKLSDEEDNSLLGLSKDARVVVAKIARQTFDKDGNLIEYCYLTDRASCYIFSYRFKAKPKKHSNR